MSPEVRINTGPEERVAACLDKATPLLNKEKIKASCYAVLMSVAFDKKTKNELCLSNGKNWVFFDSNGLSLFPAGQTTLDELLLKYARVIDRSYNAKYKAGDNEDYATLRERRRKEENQYLQKHRENISMRFINALETSVKNLVK